MRTMPHAWDGLQNINEYVGIESVALIVGGQTGEGVRYQDRRSRFRYPDG